MTSKEGHFCILAPLDRSHADSSHCSLKGRFLRLTFLEGDYLLIESPGSSKDHSCDISPLPMSYKTSYLNIFYIILNSHN